MPTSLHGSLESRRRRPWLSIAISCAAITLAVALVYFTASTVESGRLDTNETSAATRSDTASPPRTTPSTSRTCAAWKAEKARIDAAARGLPDGWYWTAAGSRPSIVAFTATVGRELDAFEQQIGVTPDEVSRAARAYLSAKRIELDALKTRTYDQDVGAAVSWARGTLSSLCR